MTDMAEMADDLVTFLRARLDQDEQTARAAADANRPYNNPTPGVHWEHQAGDRYVRTVENENIQVVGPESWSEEIEAETGAHITRHDPARVLREVEAKRRIVDWLERVVDDEQEFVRVTWLLALPYSDHADYRPEWSPDA